MFSNDGAERVLRTVYEGQPFDLGFDRGGARLLGVGF